MKEKLHQIKEALECSIEAFEKTVLYSTNDGVWINSRVKGSALWGLQDCDGNIKEAFAESASLNAIGLQECKDSVTLIDSILATLDSQELVDKVAEVINNSHPLHAEKWNTIVNLSECDGYMNAKNIVRNTRIQAKATIEVIKE